MTQRRKPGRPHYSVDMDIDDDARPVTLDARSLTLPAAAVIAVVLSSVSITYFFADERTRLDKRIDTVVGSVERLAVSISQLADGIRYGASDRYTVTHQELWCARAEVLNKNFKCPSVSNIGQTQPTTSLQSAIEGVRRESRDIFDKVQDAKTPEDK